MDGGFETGRGKKIASDHRREKHLLTKSSWSLGSLNAIGEEAKLCAQVEKQVLTIGYLGQSFPRGILGTHDAEGLTWFWNHIICCGIGVPRNPQWENTVLMKMPWVRLKKKEVGVKGAFKIKNYGHPPGEQHGGGIYAGVRIMSLGWIWLNK